MIVLAKDSLGDMVGLDCYHGYSYMEGDWACALCEGFIKKRGVFYGALKMGPLNKRLLDLPLHTPAFSVYARYLFSSLYSERVFFLSIEMCHICMVFVLC